MVVGCDWREQLCNQFPRNVRRKMQGLSLDIHTMKQETVRRRGGAGESQKDEDESVDEHPSRKWRSTTVRLMNPRLENVLILT